jgi:hypothetical protein
MAVGARRRLGAIGRADQARSASISVPVPMIFITRLRLYASTPERAGPSLR